MLARRKLPPEYLRWNRKWHAPFGRPIPPIAYRAGLCNLDLVRFTGPFAIQPNSSTRAVEYPWAYHAAPIGPGLAALEIGGGHSGFQFTLARSGAHVHNVDPFLDYGSDPPSAERIASFRAVDRFKPRHLAPERVHALLNARLGTTVQLSRSDLAAASLPAASFDVAYCISTIEHLPLPEIETTLQEASRLLKRGGKLVLTVDLFLNLHPFTDRPTNQYGTNVSVQWLVDVSRLDLVQGDKRELFGFPRFDPRHTLASLEDYMVGDYPVLSQLLVLEKRSRCHTHAGTRCQAVEKR